MSDSTTSNYHFTLPAIGASQDSWGSKLNGNWTALDGYLHSLASTGGSGGGSTSPSLPLTGGTISGNLNVNGNEQINGSLGVSGTASFVNTYAQAAAFGYPAINDFIINRNGNQRVIQFANNATEVYDPASFTYYWNNSGVKMFLDGAGDLQIAGNGTKPGGGPWTASSDDRMKRDVAPYSAGLAQILRLQPMSFQYNGQGDEKADGRTWIGLSAQATKTVMPELVVEFPPRADLRRLPNQLGTNLGPLTLALVNCCKELAARVAVLEARCPG